MRNERKGAYQSCPRRAACATSRGCARSCVRVHVGVERVRMSVGACASRQIGPPWPSLIRHQDQPTQQKGSMLIKPAQSIGSGRESPRKRSPHKLGDISANWDATCVAVRFWKIDPPLAIHTCHAAFARGAAGLLVVVHYHPGSCSIQVVTVQHMPCSLRHWDADFTRSVHISIC